MNKIQEIILEPSTVKVGDFFRVKIKIDRGFTKNLISEASFNLITEDGLNLVTEGLDNG